MTSGWDNGEKVAYQMGPILGFSKKSRRVEASHLSNDDQQVGSANGRKS